MQYKFIPVNNDLNKAIAFANTLDANYIKNTQRIKQKEFYIPTVDVIQKLQNEGWMINGVDEQRNKKTRKITNNYVQMTHPDFAVKNSKGKDEAYSSVLIKNSCSGDQPLQMSLGAYRMVCSNGMIRFVEDAETEKVKHTEVNYRDLDRFVHSLNSKAQDVIAELSTWKQKNMTLEQMRELAYNAARLRFNETDENLEMVGEFFKKIKEYFEHIFVISHNPLIRNWSDNLIMIKKEENVSSIDYVTPKIS